MEKMTSSTAEAHSDPLSIQPQLFGSVVPCKDPVTELPSSPPSYLDERKAARSRAFAKADPLMLTRYRECLRLVGNARATFGAWDVTDVYEQKHGGLDTTGKKALGALFSVLQHEGVIEEAGTGKRPNGNLASVYRLKK